MKSIDVSPAKRNIMASLARNAIAMKITPRSLRTWRIPRRSRSPSTTSRRSPRRSRRSPRRSRRSLTRISAQSPCWSWRPSQHRPTASCRTTVGLIMMRQISPHQKSASSSISIQRSEAGLNHGRDSFFFKQLSNLWEYFKWGQNGLRQESNTREFFFSPSLEPLSSTPLTSALFWPWRNLALRFVSMGRRLRCWVLHSCLPLWNFQRNLFPPFF